MKFFKKICITLLIFINLILVCQQSYASCDANKIRVLFDKKQNVRALEIATYGAEKGASECQVLLASAYMFGHTSTDFSETVHQDLVKSQYWFEQVARSGNPHAQHILGDTYLWGFFGDVNSELGFYWIKKAAQHGNSESFETLAKLYLQQFYDGQYLMASQLFRAEQWASLLAKSNQKYSVHKEVCEANQLYFNKMKATFSGLTSPIEKRCTIYKRKYSPNERDAWFADAVISDVMLDDIFPGKIVIPGASPCQFKQLESAWENKDYKASLNYARLGRSDDDDPRGQFYFGRHLEQGLGTFEAKKNITQGAQWIKKAAENGLAAAEKKLYQLYMNGTLEKNSLLASFWLAHSAKNGDPVSQFEFGDRLIHGKGVEKDASGGINWLELSAKNGFAVANSTLAVHYARGDVVDKDLYQAAHHAYLASSEGYKDAEKLHAAICREFSISPPPNFDPDSLDFALTSCPAPRDTRNTVVSKATKQTTVSENPLTDFLNAAAAAVAVGVALDGLSNQGKTSTSNTTNEASECAEIARSRVTYCSIGFNQEFGTGEIYNIDVDCRGGHKAKPCERRLEAAVQYGFIDSYYAFCDLENRKNWDEEKDRVIQRICSN